MFTAGNAYPPFSKDEDVKHGVSYSVGFWSAVSATFIGYLR